EFTYPVTADDIKEKITAVNVHWNDNKSGKREDLTDVTVSGTLNAANKVTITIGIDGTELTKTVDIKINQGEYKIDEDLFKDKSATYTGSAFDPEGWIDEDELPEGVTVTYTCDDWVSLGDHTVTAKFSHTNANYKSIGDMTAKLTISNKPAHDMTGTEFKPEAGGGLTSDGKGGYTGTYSPDGGYDIGIDPDTLPDGVTIKDTTIKKKNPDTQEWEPVDKIDGAGEYKVDVTFDGGDDYQDVEGMSTTVTIGKGTHDMDGATITPTGESTGSSGGLKPAANGGYTGTYNPDGGFVLDIDTESLPDGVTPKAPVYKKYTGKGKPEFKADGTPKDPTKWEPVSEISGAGDYIVEVGFDYDEDNYEEIKPVSAVVNIAKADVEIPEDTFKGGTVLSDGSAHKVEVKELPEGVKSVVYEYVDKNGKTVKTSTPPEFTDPGDYVVKAYFEPEDKDNYNEIEPVEITLKISDAVVESISAKLEDGAAFNTANTLDELKAKLTAEIEYNNGKKESVKVADLEITCDKLRDGNKFKAGPVSVTVKFTDESGNEVSTAVNITVQKLKVAVPTFKGGLSYTGFAVKPTVDNFNGYDGELMTFVTDKLQSGTVVGSYKAVFALNDYENYEWATTTTVSKKVFAVSVYDGEVTLLVNEVAVDWNIARAVLTATKTEGGLPVFASESYIGAIADVVTLKYYKDEACTEEVAADQLAKETTYYVKAELLDTENFDLDASAAQYTVKSFSYTTPAKELTGFEKVLAVVKANWLWIVIAVVALILLILIIALAVRSSK
ncbi:MAG: hypothetical protein K2J61_04695, partial [Clostridia bacterium]|nr:hypothetical protein [Clostridia bacterium]